MPYFAESIADPPRESAPVTECVRLCRYQPRSFGLGG